MENQKEIDLLELVKRLWKNRKMLVIYCICGFLVGVIIAFSMPKQYRSEAKIAFESRAKDNSFLSGSAMAMTAMLGVSKDMGRGINEKIYPEIMRSSPFLMEFTDIPVEYKGETTPLSDYLLHKQKRAWWSHIMSLPKYAIGMFKDADTATIKYSPQLQADFIKMLSGRMNVYIDEKTNVCTFSSTFQNPKIAATITDSMLVKLQRYMTNYRTQKTRYNLLSNTKMMEEAQEKYYSADRAYAESLDRNQNLISRAAQVKTERLRNEKDVAFMIYQQIAEQVGMDRAKLHDDTPIATVIEPAKPPVRASSPKKMNIALIFTILGGVVAAGIISYKFIFKKES